MGVSDDPCLTCGHEDVDHDELGLCAKCSCVGFRDDAEDDDDDVEELDFDDQA